jgi:uncharacterized membrane protein/nitrite reductase/ring-hydroxylating ferredoxin subunit
MKSKANIKAHPIHPMLVMFPFAFFTGALIFDVITLLSNETYKETATSLAVAGLSGGALAAIAGVIDYIYTVPPKSSASKRAAKHGILNSTVMLLFGIALYYRLNADEPMQSAIVAIEAAAVLLLWVAGWLGGTLVYRNQIGVDPRYASAGKWKERYIDEVDGQVIIDDLAELKTDQMQLVHVGNKRIVVAKTESGLVAFSDYCTHKGASLAGGAMICGTVQCPWHGSQFDVRSGQLKAGPGKENIKVYKAQESGDKLTVFLND